MIRRIALSLLCLVLAVGSLYAASESCEGLCCAMEMGATHNSVGMDGMATMGDMGGEGHGCCCTDTTNPCEWEKGPGSEHDERSTAVLFKVDPPNGPTATVVGLLELSPPPVFAAVHGFSAGASPPGGPPVYLIVQSFLC